MSVEASCEAIVCEIDQRLKPLRLERIDVSVQRDDIRLEAVWKSRIWPWQRAVAVLVVDDSVDELGRYAKSCRIPLGKSIGYIVGLLPLGLRLVLVCENKTVDKNELKKHVAKFNNRRVILQSIHVFDIAKCESESVRNWADRIESSIPEAVEQALASVVAQD